MIVTTPRAAPCPRSGTAPRRVPLWALALGALAGAGCSLGGATTDDGGGGTTPRCETCVGEDGGPPAPPPMLGRTVAVLETSAPFEMDEFVLRGTFPVPPRVYPRADGKDPFVVRDWDGTPLTTQTELVSRYANEADGADVVEVLAKVSRDPSVASGNPVRYQVVFSPHLALAGPGTIGLEDLLATQGVPATIQALLADPNGIEITTHDCFGNRYVSRPLDGTGRYRLERRGRISTELCIYQTKGSGRIV